MRRVKVGGGADEEVGRRARIQKFSSETEPLVFNEGAKSLNIDVGVLLPLAEKTIPALSPMRSALNHGVERAAPPVPRSCPKYAF